MILRVLTSMKQSTSWPRPTDRSRLRHYHCEQRSSCSPRVPACGFSDHSSAGSTPPPDRSKLRMTDLATPARIMARLEPSEGWALQSVMRLTAGRISGGPFRKRKAGNEPNLQPLRMRNIAPPQPANSCLAVQAQQVQARLPRQQALVCRFPEPCSHESKKGTRQGASRINQEPEEVSVKSVARGFLP
jgi:hypothetical protein